MMSNISLSNFTGQPDKILAKPTVTKKCSTASPTPLTEGEGEGHPAFRFPLSCGIIQDTYMAIVSSSFISYTHDSQAHMDRIWGLSEQFRGDGVDCPIDQHEEAPPRRVAPVVQESNTGIRIRVGRLHRKLSPTLRRQRSS